MNTNKHLESANLSSLVENALMQVTCFTSFTHLLLRSVISTLAVLLPLKGRSELWDRADLDTSFLTEKKFTPTRNQRSSRNLFNFRSVLLDFQSFTEKPIF